MPAGSGEKRFLLLIRVFVVAFACAAIVWGLATLPPLWRQMPAEFTARHILNGETYRSEALSRQIQLVNSFDEATCRPSAVRSAAVISLRLVEESARNGANRAIDLRQIKNLDTAIRQSLACSPADPFLWLVLYWTENTANGFNPDYLKYLKLSYELGPNEAWIVLKRNPLVLGDYDRLPADLQSHAIQEFVTLVKDSFYKEAAEIFVATAPQTRAAIIPRLANLTRQTRTTFAKVVGDQGLNVTIPDTDLPSRPGIDLRAIGR